MIRRASAGEGKRVRQRIDLYGHGLAAKLREAEYALHRLGELVGLPDSSSTEEDAFATADRLHFYVDSWYSLAEGACALALSVSAVRRS